MKMFKHAMLFLSLGIIIFSSCSDSDPRTSLLKAIPSDAVFVVGIENMQLLKKGGLDKPDNYKFFQELKDELLYGNAGMQNLFNKIIADPQSSGLDIEKSWLYGIQRESRFYCVAVFKMDDLSTFDKNVAEVLQNQESLAVDDKGDYKYLPLEKGALDLAWNKDFLFIAGGDLRNINYAGVFSIPEEKNILQVDDFQEFRKEHCDIGIWVSYDDFLQIVEENAPLGVSFPAYMYDFSGAYVHLFLSFDKGEIKLAGKMSPQSKVEEFYAKYPIIKKDFDKHLLEDFPETSYLSVKMAIQPEEYLKFMREILSASVDDYTLSMIFDNPALQTIMETWDGGLLFSIYGFAQGPFPIPLAGISFSVKNRDDFTSLLSLIPQEIVQETGNFHTINFPGFMLYTAYKDKRIFLTDEADAILAFTGQGYGKTLKNNPLAENYEKAPFLIYLNLALDTYPANIQNLSQNGAPGELINILSVLEQYKGLCYTGKNNGEYSLSLKFKDNTQNSLKLLLESIDKVDR